MLRRKRSWGGLSRPWERSTGRGKLKHVKYIEAEEHDWGKVDDGKGNNSVVEQQGQRGGGGDGR